MGKNLIIKDADFSENAIEKQYEWYVDDYLLSVQAGLSITVDVNLRRAGFSLPKMRHALYQNKVVNVVRFIAAVAGTITISHGIKASTQPRVRSVIAKIQILASEVGKEVIKQFPDTIFGDDECFVISASDDTGFFKYVKPGLAYVGSGRIGIDITKSSGYYSGDETTETSQNLAFDLGYYG